MPAPAPSDEQAPPRPIGPERLRALREAILNGTYPTEGAVTGGLAKLFRQPAGSSSPIGSSSQVASPTTIGSPTKTAPPARDG